MYLIYLQLKRIFVLYRLISISGLQCLFSLSIIFSISWVIVRCMKWKTKLTVTSSNCLFCSTVKEDSLNFLIYDKEKQHILIFEKLESDIFAWKMTETMNQFLINWLIISALSYILHDDLSRTRRHEMSVKKAAEVVEKAPRSSLDSLDNDSSSGVRILRLILSSAN